MSLTKSPLAPTGFPDLPEIKGISLASAAAGIKYEGRDDVMLAVLTVRPIDDNGVRLQSCGCDHVRNRLDFEVRCPGERGSGHLGLRAIRYGTDWVRTGRPRQAGLGRRGRLSSAGLGRDR